MEKSAEYQKPAPTVKYAEELKIAVKRFVVMNAATLLPERENKADDIAAEVSGLIVRLTNEALDELVTTLRSFATTKFDGGNNA